MDRLLAGGDWYGVNNCVGGFLGGSRFRHVRLS